MVRKKSKYLGFKIELLTKSKNGHDYPALFSRRQRLLVIL